MKNINYKDSIKNKLLIQKNTTDKKLQMNHKFLTRKKIYQNQNNL